MIEELERIKVEEEKQQAKIKTIDKNIKDKKKIAMNEKKPMNPKEGLNSIQHQLQKERNKLDQAFRKTRDTLDKNTMKFRIELEGLKEKWQNLHEKQGYLLSVKRDEEQKEIEHSKELALFEKQKKQ